MNPYFAPFLTLLYIFLFLPSSAWSSKPQPRPDSLPTDFYICGPPSKPILSKDHLLGCREQLVWDIEDRFICHNGDQSFLVLFPLDKLPYDASQEAYSCETLPHCHDTTIFAFDRLCDEPTPTQSWNTIAHKANRTFSQCSTSAQIKAELPRGFTLTSESEYIRSEAGQHFIRSDSSGWDYLPIHEYPFSVSSGAIVKKPGVYCVNRTGTRGSHASNVRLLWQLPEDWPPFKPHNAKIPPSQFHTCRSDNDCYVTSAGTCLSPTVGKHMAQTEKAVQQSGSMEKTCKCHTGPLFWGCMKSE